MVHVLMTEEHFSPNINEMNLSRWLSHQKENEVLGNYWLWLYNRQTGACSILADVGVLAVNSSCLLTQF